MRSRKGKRMELLEYFATKLGCMYLSDLHQRCYLKEIPHLLSGINPEQYPMDEWKDAVFYLTSQQRAFETQAEAKAFLASYILSEEIL